MPDEILASDLREFILRTIDSVAHLEALLLLRETSTTAWDAASAAKRLYVTEQQATEVLRHLHQEGLLTFSNGLYQYDIRTTEATTLVDGLAQAYAKQLIPITNLIHSKPRRIREFADAFKLRKDS